MTLGRVTTWTTVYYNMCAWYQEVDTNTKMAVLVVEYFDVWNIWHWTDSEFAWTLSCLFLFIFKFPSRRSFLLWYNEMLLLMTVPTDDDDNDNLLISWACHVVIIAAADDDADDDDDDDDARVFVSVVIATWVITSWCRCRSSPSLTSPTSTRCLFRRFVTFHTLH